MKKYLIGLLGLAVLVFFVRIALPSVIGTSHDLSGKAYSGGEVCVVCHTPHNVSGGQTPLWNHQLSAQASYGVYSSDTTDATDVTDIGGATAGSANISNLCLSCHDGTVAIDSFGGRTGSEFISGSANLGTSLTDDHPINFTYDATLATNDGELVPPVSASWVDAGQTVPLFSQKVQCASCHDVHDDSFGKFLIKSNAGSALCLSCHIK